VRGTFLVGLRPLFILHETDMKKLFANERVNEIAGQAAANHGVELVWAEIVGSDKEPIVRVFIDKPEGVTHEDCSVVSSEISRAFDSGNVISADYSLEVSSPGLERELYSLSDFEKFAGRLAKVKTKADINGQRNFRGRIQNVTGDEIIFDDKTNGEVKIPYAVVTKANLEIDLEEELKKGKVNS